MAAGQWVIYCLLAVLTKLSSSVDDVAWLLPYINAKAALVNALLYVVLMMCVVGLAIGAGIGGRKAMSQVVSEDGYWNAERVLSVVSGCLLSVYAVYLFYDWWTELNEDEDEDEETPDRTEPNPVSIDGALNKCDESLAAAGVPATASGSGNGSGQGKGKDLEQQQAKALQTNSEAATLRRRQRAGGGGQGAWTEAQDNALEASQVKEDILPEGAAAEDGAAAGSEPTSSSLVTVALLGSLDDFCVFFGLLLADTFHPLQLAIGVLVGSCLVVAFCKGATFFKPVVWLLERIPLWAIIGCFAVWTFVSAFVEF